MVGDQRRWLDVPYAEKDRAKAAGARWDPRRRSWYAPDPGMGELERWLPHPRPPGTGEHIGEPTPATPPAGTPRAALSARAAEVWEAEVWEDLALRPPGLGITQEAARRRAAGQSDTSWRAGADGEARLADALRGMTHPGSSARLVRWASGSAHWRVLHSVPLGPGGRHGDHVVVGPAGVITINTKAHAARRRVDVAAGVTVGGRDTDYVAKSLREAERAAALLAAAATEQITRTAIASAATEDAPGTSAPGRTNAVMAAIAAGHRPRGGPGCWPPVYPAIVVIGAPLHGRDRPGGVLVLTPKTLPRMLAALPAALSTEQVEAVYGLARRSTTWTRPC